MHTSRSRVSVRTGPTLGNTHQKIEIKQEEGKKIKLRISSHMLANRSLERGSGGCWFPAPTSAGTLRGSGLRGQGAVPVFPNKRQQINQRTSDHPDARPAPSTCPRGPLGGGRFRVPGPRSHLAADRKGRMRNPALPAPAPEEAPAPPWTANTVAHPGGFLCFDSEAISLSN